MVLINITVKAGFVTSVFYMTCQKCYHYAWMNRRYKLNISKRIREFFSTATPETEVSWKMSSAVLGISKLLGETGILRQIDAKIAACLYLRNSILPR